MHCGYFFSGSGTTVIVAEQLNRRWIAVDSSPFAAFTLRKRLIDLHSSGGLLLAKNTTTFEYPNRLEKLEIEIKSHENKLRIIPQTTNKIEQISIGTIENETFLPTHNIISNKKAQVNLDFDCKKGSAMHIIDSSGKHGFYM